MALNEKAVLVVLQISKWNSNKRDKAANETVETTHRTHKGVGNYSKKLIPGSEELKEINRIEGAIRKHYYENTSPWMHEGPRIIKGSELMPFTKEFRKLKRQYDAAVREFIQKYPALRTQAKRKLGTLFNEADYPTVQELPGEYNCEIDPQPVPTVNDFRIKLGESEKKRFISKIKGVETNVTKDAWSRMHKVLQKAVQRVNSKDKIIKDSLVENILEMCDLMKRLNVMDDPKLEKARVEIEKKVTGIDMKKARKSKIARKEVGKQLNQTMSAMSAFMGKKDK